MAEILGALVKASPGDLKARNGPRAWARRQSVGGAPFPRSKADAGRQLVSWIQTWLKEHHVDLDDDRRVLALPPSTNEDLSFCEWIEFVVSSDARAAGWGQPCDADIVVVQKRIVSELRKTIRRLRCTPEHLAIAVLVGWGMSRSKAKDALKYT
jgi:hypothetical protein